MESKKGIRMISRSHKKAGATKRYPLNCRPSDRIRDNTEMDDCPVMTFLLPARSSASGEIGRARNETVEFAQILQKP